MNIKQMATILGKKGGLKTKNKMGNQHYSNMGKLSAQLRKERREKLLSMFTVGEVQNPATKQSVAEALENLDK